MKVVILAGGLGTRLGEETHTKPKPMVCVGEKPILWHIMKSYSYYGFNDFVICGGYKIEVIKNYFYDYFLNECDATYNLSNGVVTYDDKNIEKWIVGVVNTGLTTMTGGRIGRIKEHVKNNRFMITYGDGVSDVNINSIIEEHNKSGNIVTLTAVRPEGRFGVIDIGDNNKVTRFAEKDAHSDKWINGGFLVVEPQIFNYIKGDSCILETDVLPVLAKEGKLGVYKHTGFWQCMDKISDKNYLDDLLKNNKAPWKKY